MEGSPDRDLVEQTRRGRIDAYGELVRRYQTSVFNVCYRMLGERQEAEDLAQDAFLRAYQRLETFDVERPFGPWIRKVAANLCLNSLQKHSPPRLSLDEEYDDPIDVGQPDPAEVHERADQANRLRLALTRLPAHYRAVIELRHFHDMSYEEMARSLALPLSDIKTHLFRARRLLARQLQSPEAEVGHASG
ncbi:MAG TPA: sigma-70 family RNA polymerase sigma factor [Anaerolineales bacterium]|nr:sigma-70 family RNA polymerase sigma factor [Anaerolineales bacterium]